jgi:O-antigen/teichoic acid export membrane protein
MSRPLRHLVKDIAVYGSGDVLLRATAFITMPIYTRIFNLDDYGTLNFVLTVTALLGAVLALGGDAAYGRYYFEARTDQERQLLTSSWLGFLAVWSAGIVILGLPFVGLFSTWAFGTPEQGLLFALALLTAPLTLINLLCGQALRNQFRAHLFTVLSVTTTLLTIGLSLVGVVVLQLGLAGVLGGTLLAAALILPVRLWTVRDLLRPVFSVDVVKQLLHFGLPFVPAGLAVWIFATSDRIVLGKLSTLDQLGLFAVATSVVSVLALVNGAIGQAWSPHALIIYEADPEAARPFYGRIMTYILASFGLLTVGITAFADLVLKVVAAPAFYPAAAAVGPLALGFFAYASIHVSAIGISLQKQTRYFALYCWIAALLNVALNLLFVPRWGMMAASWATALTYGFLTLAYLRTSQRLWRVTYETRRALAAVALVVAFTIGAMYLPSMPLLEGVVVKSLYCLLFVVMLVAARVVDRREWLALASLLPQRVTTAKLPI